MRIGVRLYHASPDPDMTPMIDIVFQLVVFFMLTLNFSADEQNELIRLPASELAKPTETRLETFITLQLTSRGTVVVGGDEVPVEGVARVLDREREALSERKKSTSEATIIIRADGRAQAGKVQQLIEISQTAGFEQFILRAKEQEGVAT
ncbi:MAG: ExbD/TolR family protein [Planctomycetota bacterium]